jgi:hypothetical protein
MQLDAIQTDELLRELERRQRADLTRMVQRGMAARARNGLPPGRIPLGYKAWGKRILIVEPAASHIREAFRWLDEGMPVRAAWRRVTEAGLRNRRGKPLSASSFLLIVHNPFYAGLIRFGGVLHLGSHNPLLPEEMFQRVQERIGKARTRE